MYCTLLQLCCWCGSRYILLYSDCFVCGDRYIRAQKPHEKSVTVQQLQKSLKRDKDAMYVLRAMLNASYEGLRSMENRSVLLVCEFE